MPVNQTDPDRDVPDRVFWPFLLLTFGIAWGVFALFAAFPDQITALMGAPSGQHPLFVLAVYAPAISAVLLVGWHTGLSGVGRFLSRLLLWRMPGIWWAVLLLGIPAIFAVGAAIKGTLLPFSLPEGGAGALLGALAFMAILGPVEEFGWRGLLQPVLQRRMAPVWAGLATGAVWGVWHLPAFFLSGTPQAAWGFFPFLIGTMAISVILTGMFNAARGSILIAALFHFQMNNPLWPDAQPYDTWVFVGAAVLMVWLCRGAMLTRGDAVTRVVPG
jgi:membrane protease YdiL (CAAX protease family)